jgi:uncharacterized membrane protein
MLWIWLQAHATDLIGLLFHVGVFTGYRALQRRRALRDAGATLQSQQARIRAAWVAELISTKNGILGVQTLRNAMMAVLFFASNTMFLVIGTLTLIGQGQVAESWALLDPEGMRPAPFAHAKIMLLLFTLLTAFFCFLNAIRLFSHASVSIGASNANAAPITAQLDTAWRYQGLGVRCYYFGAPIMFWLFGAPWLVLASIGAVALMQLFDRVPSRG